METSSPSRTGIVRRRSPLSHDDATAGLGEPMPAIKCKATRTDDAPCRAPALDDGEELCLWHSERWRDVRLAKSRQGGLRRTIELPSAEALTPAKARELLAAASSALLNGSLDANTVRSLAYALMVDRQVRSTEEMDSRMAQLEEQIAAVGGGKNGELHPANGRLRFRKVDMSELRRKARDRFHG